MADEKELKDNRFSYLLQPIRDLAANWDINIAGELEEYLEELENLTFTIEGCGPALNFAEAALLIQGTTCVFSKKVEYLHNLVYQALETIFNKKQKERQAAANKNKTSRRGDGCADELDDADAFFNLGQQLELAGHADINLDDDDETSPPELLRPPTALLALEDAACGQGGQAGSGTGEAGSYRLAQCAVHASGALLLEARDGELFDAWLRPIGSRSHHGTSAADMGFGAAAGGLMCDIMAGLAGLRGSDGTAAAGAATGEQQQQEQGQPDGFVGGETDPGHGGYADDGDDFGAGCYGMMGDDAVQEVGENAAAAADADMPEAAAATVQQEEEGAAAAGGGVGQADGDMPDWLSQPAAGDEAIQEQQQAADAGDDAAAAGDEAAAADEAAAGGRVRQQRGRTKQGDAAAAAGGYYDPYLPLDPAQPGSLPIKPLQVRKPKRKTAPSMLQHRTAGSNSAACLNASHHPQLHWPEFGYLLDRLAAAAAAARISGSRRGRAGQQQAAHAQPAVPGLLSVGPQVASVMDWQDAAAAEQREAQVLMMGDGGGDGEDGAAGDFGGDGYEDDYYAGSAAAGADLLGDMSVLEDAGQEGGGLRPWATGGAMPDWMAGSAGGGAAGGSGELTYEELCRSHIESLIAAAAAQQVQSELAVRVSGWRARIDPILSAEEDRSAFDIHDYGTKILDRLVEAKEQQPAALPEQQHQETEAAVVRSSSSEEVIDFKQVAGASDSYEVCRLFAAMLQLVNNRNINLVKHTEEEDEEGSRADAGGRTCSRLQLQLLTVARVHEAMAEGLAGGAEGGGLQAQDGQLEAPPPRSRAAPKKAKGKKGAAAAEGGGDEAGAAAKAKGGKSSKGKAAVGKGRKTAKTGGEGWSSGDDDGDDDGGGVSDMSASDEEPGPAPPAARKAAAKGKSAAGRSKAATAAGDGDASSDEFDAEAENQEGVRAAAAAAKGKAGHKPPAKKAKRAGLA